MYRLLEKLFNIRKGEVLISLFMFSYIYLLLVTYYFLKPARDGLFLAQIPWTQLPIVFILIAIVAVPVNQLHAAAGRKLRLNSLLNVTMVLLIVSLLGMRTIVATGTTWAMYTFYIWVSIYGVLATSQFWLFANAIYSPTQAKRLFIFLNLGAIIGAFTGGEVTSFAIKTFGVQTENLLYFCVGFLLCCIVIINIIWMLKRQENDEERARPRRREEPKENIMQVFKTIKSSRHLSLIVGIIAMTMATASFIDVQFKGITQEAFTDNDARTAFFGVFYGRLSLISLALQLFFSYRLLRILGVGGIISFLPIGLVLGSATMLIMPGLVAGVLLRGSDGVFKYSLDKTGRELLFLPVPLDIKKRTKIFIDVIVDRWFRGIAGGLLLLFTLVFGFSIRQLSLVVLALLALWLFFVILIRKEYINAFRKALERRDIDLSELRSDIAGASTVNALTEALKSTNERQIVYALDMLSSVRTVDLTEHLVPLLGNTSHDVKLRAMTLLRSGKNDTLQKDFENLLHENDPDIQLEAMRYLYFSTHDNRTMFMKTYLDQPDQVLKATVLVCLSESAVPEELKLVNRHLFETLITVKGEQGIICRKYVARAIGNLGDNQYYDYLKNMLEDESSEIVKEAILSIGRTQDRHFIPLLMDMLTTRNFRKETREALAAYGKSVVGTMSDYLEDRSIPEKIRNNIPVILSMIPTQDSVNVLIGALTTDDILLKQRIIKALNKLHTRFPDIPINQQQISAAFLAETKTYYEILQILHIHEKNSDGDAGQLLNKSLEETLDRNLEQIFRLLGLKYHPDDIFIAYLGITSSKRNLRDSAIEFLDNVLGKDQKKYLFPILDRDADEIAIRQGRSMFEINEVTIEESLEYLLTGTNAWLKTCAIYYLKEHENGIPESLQHHVQEAARDEHEFIKETAQYILNITKS